MKTSENIDQISKSVSIAQGEMNPASKSTVNPFFKSTYSNLTQVWDAIREPLSKNNLSVFQDVVTTSNGIAVTTRLAHSSGQWMEFGPLEINLIKKDAQSLGSATSYAKRYALCAAVGVVSDEDDDGEKAMARDIKDKKTVVQKEIETPEMANAIVEAYLSKYMKHDLYDKSDIPNMKSYLGKYTAHHKKTFKEAIEDYRIPEHFERHYDLWIKKQVEEELKTNNKAE